MEVGQSWRYTLPITLPNDCSKHIVVIMLDQIMKICKFLFSCLLSSFVVVSIERLAHSLLFSLTGLTSHVSERTLHFGVSKCNQRFVWLNPVMTKALQDFYNSTTVVAERERAWCSTVRMQYISHCVLTMFIVLYCSKMHERNKISRDNSHKVFYH